MASNAKSENDRQPGLGRGKFLIPSILDEPENQDLFPGSPHASHALEIIQGNGGISETLRYVEDLFKTLPLKVIEARHSEEGEIELKATSTKLQEALVMMVGLVQGMSGQATMVVRH